MHKKLLYVLSVLLIAALLLPMTVLGVSAVGTQLTVDGTEVCCKTYDGTVNATAFLGSVSGIEIGDDVEVVIASATFEDKNAGSGKAVLVTYSLIGDDASKYTDPANDYLSANINPAQLSVSNTTVENKVYDGNTNAVATVGVVSGIIEGDDVTVIVKSAEFADAEVGKNKPVTVSYAVSGEDAADYTAPTDDVISANITDTHTVKSVVDSYISLIELIISVFKTVLAFLGA